MTNKTVIGWLVLAVVLGAAAIFLLNRGGGTGGGAAAGERIFEFSPSEVTGFDVARADETTDRVRRSARGEWTLEIVRTGTASPAWPLMSEQVHAMLRHLADVKAVAKADKATTLGDRPTVVTVQLGGGREVTMRLAERTLGGVGLIETTPGAADVIVRAMVSDEVHRALREPGPREWRDRAVFAGSGALADVSRVRMENLVDPQQVKSLALGRVQGKWSVREPLQQGAPADAGAVQRLMTSLGEIRIAEFLDQGAGAATGLDKPMSRLTVESDVREVAGADVRTGVVKRTLAIGSPADARSERLFASIQADGEASPRVVLIDARAMLTLTMDPGAYLSAAPSGASAPDIGMIHLAKLGPSGAPAGSAADEAGVIYKRGVDRWVRMQPDGTELLLVESDLAAVEMLATFLTSGGMGGAPAAAAGPVIAVAAPQNYVSVARIGLLSLNQSPLDTIEVGLGGSAARAAGATLRTGEVYRSWPADRLPRLLAELVSASRPAMDAAGVPESDINK